MRTIPFVLLAGLAAAPALACDPAPQPVVTLDYGSRYIDDDDSRSTVDAESNAAVNAALGPVDDFLRDLVQLGNSVLRDGSDAEADAACALSQIATWAEADALSDLDSFTANLSVGARISGFAEVYRQIRPRLVPSRSTVAVEEWLAARAAQQVDFWEMDATSGARVGNLRAWAALAVLNVGAVTQDAGLRFWAYASVSRILCTARADGSLPQETRRGRYGLHYMFHALSPLVTIAARAQSDGVDLMTICDGALTRVVDYTMNDYAAGGIASEGYSGERQSYFDGSSDMGAHELAWLAPWALLAPGSPHIARAGELERLSNSKLGGDQALIWGAPAN